MSDQFTNHPAPTLADRYDAICDEALALAETWRDLILKSSIDSSFKAEQHRRCLLRAARFARLADKARERTP